MLSRQIPGVRKDPITAETSSEAWSEYLLLWRGANPRLDTALDRAADVHDGRQTGFTPPWQPAERNDPARHLSMIHHSFQLYRIGCTEAREAETVAQTMGRLLMAPSRQLVRKIGATSESDTARHQETLRDPDGYATLIRLGRAAAENGYKDLAVTAAEALLTGTYPRLKDAAAKAQELENGWRRTAEAMEEPPPGNGERHTKAYRQKATDNRNNLADVFTAHLKARIRLKQEEPVSSRRRAMNIFRAYIQDMNTAEAWRLAREMASRDGSRANMDLDGPGHAFGHALRDEHFGWGRDLARLMLDFTERVNDRRNQSKRDLEIIKFPRRGRDPSWIRQDPRSIEPLIACWHAAMKQFEMKEHPWLRDEALRWQANRIAAMIARQATLALPDNDPRVPRVSKESRTLIVTAMLNPEKRSEASKAADRLRAVQWRREDGAYAKRTVLPPPRPRRKPTDQG